MTLLQILRYCPPHRLNIATCGTRCQHNLKSSWAWVMDYSNQNDFSSIPVKLRVIQSKKRLPTYLRQPCVEDFKMPPSVTVARFAKAPSNEDSGPAKESSAETENFQGSFIGPYIEAFKKRFMSEPPAPQAKAEEKKIPNETPPKSD